MLVSALARFLESECVDLESVVSRLFESSESGLVSADPFLAPAPGEGLDADVPLGEVLVVHPGEVLGALPADGLDKPPVVVLGLPLGMAFDELTGGVLVVRLVLGLGLLLLLV